MDRSPLSPYIEGVDASRAGQAISDNPYPFDSDDGKAWRDGHKAGQNTVVVPAGMKK